ncbi:hypothetical protein NC652_035108 [Populus alba x Populus x berolinensis]|nr:hypothetical protein NC652_035108 [Populus alba x Populus x berolinensis]
MIKKILEDPHWKANFLMIQFFKVLTGHLLPLPISCAVMLLRILHMYGKKQKHLGFIKVVLLEGKDEKKGHENEGNKN